MNVNNYDIWESVKKNVYDKTIKDVKEVIENCEGDVGKVLKFALDSMCEVTHSVAGTFWYYDVNDTKCIVAKAVRGGADLSNIRLKPGEGIAGKVISEGKGYKNYDVRNDPNWSSKTDSETNFVTKTMICVPMTVNNYTFGCIQLINKLDDSYFDDDDFNIASELADNISDVIDKYKIFSEIRDFEDAAVMCIRINNYDQISQNLEPKKNIELLNTFYGDLTSIITNNNGGYAFFYNQIIAYWINRRNNEKEIGADTYKCVKEVLKASDSISKIAYGHYKCNVDVSIGISYGPVYCQEIGVEDNKVRTVVGSTVNNATNIQSYAKEGKAYVDREYAEITGKDCRIGKVKVGGGLFSKGSSSDLYEILL